MDKIYPNSIKNFTFVLSRMANTLLSIWVVAFDKYALKYVIENACHCIALSNGLNEHWFDILFLFQPFLCE